MSAIVCPDCAAPRMPAHPAGALAWQHTNSCALREREDATKVADAERLAGYLGALGLPWQRPATPTERTLLEACGIALPTDAVTTVTLVAGRSAVVRRSWPGVDTAALDAMDAAPVSP